MLPATDSGKVPLTPREVPTASQKFEEKQSNKQMSPACEDGARRTVDLITIPACPVC